MAEIEAVLFDLGGVLLPFDRERRVRAIDEATGAGEAAVRAFMADPIHGRLDRGEADEADLAGALSALANRPVGKEEACDLILSVFEAPNAEGWALARALGERLVVGGFSDNPPFVRRVFPPGARLDPLVLSSEIGACKPSAEAFRGAQERVGLGAAAILFVDDTAANVEAALAHGWDAIHYVSNAQLVGELRMRGMA